MEPEFQAQPMNIVSQCLESHAARCRRKPIGRGSVSTVMRQRVFYIGFACSFWIDEIPALVYHNVLPSKALEMLCHPIGVSFDVRLGDCPAIAVPTVPSHRRRRGEHRSFSRGAPCRFVEADAKCIGVPARCLGWQMNVQAIWLLLELVHVPRIPLAPEHGSRVDPPMNENAELRILVPIRYFILLEGFPVVAKGALMPDLVHPFQNIRPRGIVF